VASFPKRDSRSWGSQPKSREHNHLLHPNKHSRDWGDTRLMEKRKKKKSALVLGSLEKLGGRPTENGVRPYKTTTVQSKKPDPSAGGGKRKTAI